MNQFIIIIGVLVLYLVYIVVRYYLYKNISEPFEEEEWKKHTIPHKIWQTYVQSDLPESAKKCQNTWFDQAGFKYNFMNDNQIDYFIKKHFNNKIYKAFKALPLGVMKADMWRYCVLYKYGGVYSDIDSKLVKPLSQWNIKNEDKLIIGLENSVHFCQWTIACVAKHPILWNVIEAITEDVLAGIDTTDPHFVHKYTGPGIWTRVIKENLEMQSKSVEEIYHMYKEYQKYNEYKKEKEKQEKQKEQKSKKPEQKDKTSEQSKKSDEMIPVELPIYSVFKKWGVRIEGRPFFNKEYVQNLNGSNSFSDGYQSWTKQRDEIVKKK